MLVTSRCWQLGLLLRLAVILLAASTVITESDNEKRTMIRMLQRAKRIIGGQEITSAGQYPWLVGLRGHFPTKMISYFAVNYQDVYCGGAIINKRWIVTAAHCFAVPGIDSSSILNPKNWYIKAGDIHLSFTVGQKLCAIWNRIRRIEDMHCWYLGIDKIIIHPEFSQQDNWLNDIALVKLSSDLPLAPVDNTVNKIPLPLATNSSTWPPVGTNCMIQGWGCTVYGGGVQSVARTVNLPIVDDSQCSELIQPAFGPTRICAGVANSNTGVCKGDSGGGLICANGSGSGWTLAGIASFTSSNVPSVFTRVSAYMSWINSTMTSQ